MADTVVTSKPCTRCGGSGQYSFNLIDGTRCYGCGGTGLVPAAPKGQKAIKPTAADINVAQVGDIVKHRQVLYRVEDIKWIKTMNSGWYWINQRARVTRLVDGKELFIKREFMGYDPESQCWSIDVAAGTKSTGRTGILTPDELIGTLYTPDQYDERNKKVVALSQEEKEHYARFYAGAT